MRINHPVTSAGHELREGQQIVSRTDAKGVITFVNRDFIEISGYPAAELMGQPHNVIRHPDMPPEAFKDMWTTLKAGKPWNGIVKNRCKNGDYYWVEANVTPLRENGSTTGYLSVRTRPTRAQIEAASALYALMREGRAPRRGWWSRAQSKLGNISLGMRLQLVLAFLCFLMTLGTVIALSAIGRSNDRLEHVYRDRMVPAGYLASINDLMRTNVQNMLAASMHDPKSEASKLHNHPLDEHLKNIEDNNAEITNFAEAYMSSNLTAAQRTLRKL